MEYKKLMDGLWSEYSYPGIKSPDSINKTKQWNGDSGEQFEI